MDIAILIVQTVTLMLVGWISHYVLSRVKAAGAEVGRIEAQVKCLDDIKKVLDETTTTVEKIKSDIGHFDWVRRERMTLLRQKLEDVVAEAFNVQHTMNLYRLDVSGDSDGGALSAAMNRLTALVACYFPALVQFRAQMTIAALKHQKLLVQRQHANKIWNIALTGLDFNLINATAAEARKVDANTKADRDATYDEFCDRINVLINAATEKMVEFMPQ